MTTVLVNYQVYLIPLEAIRIKIKIKVDAGGVYVVFYPINFRLVLSGYMNLCTQCCSNNTSFGGNGCELGRWLNKFLQRSVELSVFYCHRKLIVSEVATNTCR
jgi:hypothetical protein